MLASLQPGLSRSPAVASVLTPNPELTPSKLARSIPDPHLCSQQNHWVLFAQAPDTTASSGQSRAPPPPVGAEPITKGTSLVRSPPAPSPVPQCGLTFAFILALCRVSIYSSLRNYCMCHDILFLMSFKECPPAGLVGVGGRGGEKRERTGSSVLRQQPVWSRGHRGAEIDRGVRGSWGLLDRACSRAGWRRNQPCPRS